MPDLPGARRPAGRVCGAAKLPPWDDLPRGAKIAALRAIPARRQRPPPCGTHRHAAAKLTARADGLRAAQNCRRCARGAPCGRCFRAGATLPPCCGAGAACRFCLATGSLRGSHGAARLRLFRCFSSVFSTGTSSGIVHALLCELSAFCCSSRRFSSRSASCCSA